MLLHKRAESIRSFGPFRITVSLDGASPEGNDPLRGLQGAFRTTIDSIRRFLEAAPEFRNRLVVSSCLHNERNVQSLLAMPTVLKHLGLMRWNVGFALEAVDDQVQPVESVPALRRWVDTLREIAEGSGILPHGSPRVRTRWG